MAEGVGGAGKGVLLDEHDGHFLAGRYDPGRCGRGCGAKPCLGVVCAGGLAALIVSLLGGQLWLQVAVFLAVSAVALALTRPLSKRLLNRRRERTNADRVVGAAGLVTQDIDNVRATGRVSVMGNSWSARSVQPEGRIPAGTRVRVHAIEGVKLLVTPEAAPAQEEKER